MSPERHNKKESGERADKVILTLSNVSASKGSQEILTDVNLDITQGEHVALVGPNGVGKTTLLKIIIGEEQPNSGSIFVARGINVAYVPQSIENVFPRGEQNRTILEYFVHAKGLDTIQKRMQEIEAVLSQRSTNTQEFLKEYGELQYLFEQRGGYTLESDAQVVMEGVGLGGSIDLSTPISRLSGGEKTKLLLAQALISNADLLLLDEPSNHLDPNSVAWLADYLKKFKGALLIISHKQEFLEVFSEKVVELSLQDRGAYTYTGNYSSYLEQKTHRDLNLQRKEKRTNAEIARLQEMANRFRAGVRAKTSKDRQKKIAKIESERPTKKKKEKVMRKGFEVGVQSGYEVLKTFGLIKRYGETVLDYSDINLNILRGEKIAIVGPVGAGKSTLLKIIAGIEKPDSGNYTLGHNVDIGYYSQEMEDLNVDNTVLNEMRTIAGESSDQRLRSFLGAFLFSGDDVFKPISVLSFGERSRVMLAKLALKKHNFLVLDEPSNHLDLASRNSVARMLNEYEGSILLVSHDKEFMQGIGLNRIINLPEGTTTWLV
jgi:ATP-binding cassette subfamily F protein 3